MSRVVANVCGYGRRPAVVSASASPNTPGWQAGIRRNVTRVLKRREEIDRQRAKVIDELVRALDTIARQEVESLKPDGGSPEERVDHVAISVDFHDEAHASQPR